MASRKNRMTIHEWDGVHVLDLKEIEIWDGADLALIRETLSQLIKHQERRSVGVEMRYVKYVPSGFFGMLYDWHEQGVAIRVYSPQPHVKNMRWFQQFFDQSCEHCHPLLDEPNELALTGHEVVWDSENGWSGADTHEPQPQPESVSAAAHD